MDSERGSDAERNVANAEIARLHAANLEGHAAYERLIGIVQRLKRERDEALARLERAERVGEAARVLLAERRAQNLIIKRTPADSYMTAFADLEDALTAWQEARDAR